LRYGKPSRIFGENVPIAAGLTVTEDVTNDALVIAGAKQVVKLGWK
jgi:bifunctional UDP-N-acetylglucosamine pyrophosphorylase / glucosamine-1-phosphate N-acetyltransferase